jgi:ketosteroid isomerase-like protein
MSSANLDLVRALFAGWERGEFATAEWADPEIEFTLADGPDPGSWTGLAGMAEGWRAFQSAWEGFRSEPTAYRELDDEHVLALVRFVGRAKTSGMDLEQMQTKQASLLQIRGGKVTRLVLYWDRDRAFADLGLEPDSGT